VVKKVTQPSYDVFISFKHLDEVGRPTRDSELAQEVFTRLEQDGLKVFMSGVSLERHGVDRFKRAIDEALDSATTLVVVGTSSENLGSQWVRYEWDSFFSDVLNGVKTQGRVFVYLERVETASLPRALRQAQAFHHSHGSLDRLSNFIAGGLSEVMPHPVAQFTRIAGSFSYDVFLSHSSKDKPVVRRLAERLRADGLRVWLDDWEIRPGDHIPRRIDEGLDQSAALVLCMSAASLGSDWAFLESQAFRFTDPVNYDLLFIPLRLDDTERRASLRKFPYIDWRDGGSDGAYSRLLSACRNQQERITANPKDAKQASVDLDARHLEKLLVHDVSARIERAGLKCIGVPMDQDHGIDLEIEFTDQSRGAARRMYLQLRAGNVHLAKRKSDGAEIFRIPKQSWVDYWIRTSAKGPVMLVIGTLPASEHRGTRLNGIAFEDIRWMEIGELLRKESANGPVKQLVFEGERLDYESILRWRDRVLRVW